MRNRQKYVTTCIAITACALSGFGCGSDSGAKPNDVVIAGANAQGTAGASAGVAAAGNGGGSGDGSDVTGNAGATAGTGTGVAGMGGEAGTMAMMEPPPPAEGCPDKTMWTGTFANHVVTPTTWTDAGMFAFAGSGTIEQWLLVKQVYDKATDKLTVTSKVCRMTLPSFHVGSKMLMVDNTIHLTYSDAALQAPGVPEIVVQSTPSADAKSFTTDLGALIMGIKLADPIHDMWPASYTNAMPVDSDGDGKPGMTVTSDGPNAPQADGTGFGPEITQYYVATRTVFSNKGQITTCDRTDGTSTFGPEGINSMTLGCALASGGFGGGGGGGGECNAVQTQFSNENTIQYMATSSMWRQDRLKVDATCADVLAYKFD